MKEIIGNAQKERHIEVMATFKEWIRNRYGRDIEPGDKFELTFPDGDTLVSTVAKDGYIIDHGQPMLKTTEAHYNLGKSRLTKYKGKLL